jgi:predicted RNA binding protein YcfA (HicA-like mRNA interferase family)
MKIFKVNEIIKYIEADGWYFVRQRGSHRHFRHATKIGTTTIPGKLSEDLHPDTAKSILKQAGLIKNKI